MELIASVLLWAYAGVAVVGAVVIGAELRRTGRR